jgi:hypothetical protein
LLIPARNPLASYKMTDTKPDLSRYLHRKDLTFRQAEGVHPLPKMLTYGELDKDIRLHIWDALFGYFDSNASFDRFKGETSFDKEGQIVAALYCRDVLHLPVDDAIVVAKKPSGFIKKLKDIVLHSDYSDCLEAVQFFLRFHPWSKQHKQRLRAALDVPTSPYKVVDLPPLTIVPRGDENERAAFDQDWPEIASSSFQGAKTHLRLSAEALNAGAYPAAMREAIHAVESAVKIMTGNPKATLGDGLKELEKGKVLHSALKEAFSKLYGYASDEKGVRHALINADNADVGQEDAMFFFSACTAFVAYLARKSEGQPAPTK